MQHLSILFLFEIQDLFQTNHEKKIVKYIITIIPNNQVKKISKPVLSEKDHSVPRMVHIYYF